MAPTKEELLAVERVAPAELAALIRAGGNRPPLVVDVRDEDFELKGHLVGAVHLPQENFAADADVDALVSNFSAEFDEIVFHCGRSNTRGPTCALRFQERLDATNGPKPRVRVLAGGFAAFAEVSSSGFKCFCWRLTCRGMHCCRSSRSCWKAPQTRRLLAST